MKNSIKSVSEDTKIERIHGDLLLSEMIKIRVLFTVRTQAVI